METIGNRLEKARLAAGFTTPLDAATSLGVPYPTYKAHENGTGLFKLDTAAAYARKFKVSLDWLITGKGKGPGEVDETLDALLAVWPSLPDRIRTNLVEFAQSFLDEQRKPATR